MQFNITTDYAIRILLLLGSRSERVTGQQLAVALGIPETYVPNIIQRLRQGHLVKTIRGKHGGNALAKAPSDITLFDVITVMEGPLRINRCLEPDGYCSRFSTSCCTVHDIYASIQSDMIASLRAWSIADILKRTAERQSQAVRSTS